MAVGRVDTSVQTALPALPSIRGVRANVTHDSVAISFEPVDGARDYRVYELPTDAQVMPGADGHLNVRDATYRCAGDRQMPDLLGDRDSFTQFGLVRTQVDDVEVEGVRRTIDDATLGHVYVEPGEGRLPVYALGSPAVNADNVYRQFARFTSTRLKRYTTDEGERARLLSEGWWDVGIAFYSVAAGTARARPIYEQADKALYYAPSAESDARGTENIAFYALDAASDATSPLMRVHYDLQYADDHDELVAGRARFERARVQGAAQPLFDLQWGGLTKETILVVEALAEGCPYDGFVVGAGDMPATEQYPEWRSVESARASSPTGEVYVNGQHDGVESPRPIARSFVRVAPGARPNLDFFAGFGTDAEPRAAFSAIDCGHTDHGVPTGNCWANARYQSEQLDIGFMSVADERYTFMPQLGELWVGYGDMAADTNGKVRITPRTTATMAADSYLYVTMETNALTGGRRYPQIIVSDQQAPVQYNMEHGRAFVVQTFEDFPNSFELQLCDHQFWDTNNQCPFYDLEVTRSADDHDVVTSYLPHDPVIEHIGMDRSTRFEAYLSSRRAFLFLDGMPHGCVDLPASGEGVPMGEVTVTFGDVLYHSGVAESFGYTARVLQTESLRHYDNLGFRSGAAEPAWDFDRFPCTSIVRNH
jgi:hypothetical protein